MTTSSTLDYLLIIALISSFLIDSNKSSSTAASNEKQLKNLIKTSRPNFKVKCQDLLKDFNPHVEKRTFLVTRDQTSLISKHAKNSTFERLSNQCPSTIEANANRLELVWRYQFFESTHCIRVELDLGNLTLFRQVLDYKYYMFSYREFGSKNIHLKRQLIEEQSNSLTINRAYIRPYIVCVSFYKRDFSMVSNHTSNGYANEKPSNESIADCRKFSQELLDDQKLQNVDLCIDIDTPTHFLSITDHGFHGVNRELMMVIFILCLTVVVLSTIATCRFLIDRPRKKRYKQLKEYLTKRRQHLFQSTTGSHGSLNRDRLLGSNPSMIIVSHQHTHHHHPNSHQLQENVHGGSQQFDPCEMESLLQHGHASNASLPSYSDETSNAQPTTLHHYDPSLSSSAATASTAVPIALGTGNLSSNSHPVQTHGKIFFSVGETILEDLAGEATSSSDLTLKEKMVETAMAAAAISIEAGNEAEKETSLEGTEEALKTVSHLLDDKPWSLTRRDSKSAFAAEKSNLASVASQARMNP